MGGKGRWCELEGEGKRRMAGFCGSWEWGPFVQALKGEPTAMWS